MVIVTVFKAQPFWEFSDGPGLPMKNRHIGRRAVVLLFVASLLGFLFGCGGGDSGTVSSTPPPSGGTDTGIPRIDSIRQEFLDAVNQARSVGRNCGSTSYPNAPPVAWNNVLATAAYLHSEDMATNQFFSHTGADGSSPETRITRQGYDWRTYGENIAWGYPTASAVTQGWLGSDGHCRNIMNPSFTEIGAAYSDGSYQGIPSVSFWTLDLAAPR